MEAYPRNFGGKRTLPGFFFFFFSNFLCVCIFSSKYLPTLLAGDGERWRAGLPFRRLRGAGGQEQSSGRGVREQA